MSTLPLPRPAGAGPACTCACTGDGATSQAPTAGGEPASSGGRFGPTHALILIVVFLGLGCALFSPAPRRPPSSR
ncbi:hypothetical protein [Streptomyces sp. Root264]|uniref:hypothetical protein n=1 Tax=Streptomyces sp. Root264 TaxID=1736503 RepID=UPI000AAB62B2|nr:hypothetical protein [Streptomyces sp. Root264]